MCMQYMRHSSHEPLYDFPKVKMGFPCSVPHNRKTLTSKLLPTTNKSIDEKITFATLCRSTLECVDDALHCIGTSATFIVVCNNVNALAQPLRRQ